MYARDTVYTYVQCIHVYMIYVYMFCSVHYIQCTYVYSQTFCFFSYYWRTQAWQVTDLERQLVLQHLTDTGVQGCTLAERRRKVPASAIGAPIHVSSFPNCISNSPNTNHHKDKLNNDNSKHHGDVINKHTTSNNSCLDKLDEATQESREFDLGVASGSGLQVIEDAAQQQASLWQGGQVGLFLVLCVNSMQFLLVLVFTVSMFCFNLLIHNSWGSTL